MLALTVWQPWASLIVGAPPSYDSEPTPPQKPVENRNWPAPRSALGERIAIHAGKAMNGDVLESFHDVFKAKTFGSVRAPYRTPGDFPRGAVVGVATLDRVIGPIDDRGDVVSVCSVEEYEAATAARRDPRTVGFRKSDILSSRAYEPPDGVPVPAPVSRRYRAKVNRDRRNGNNTLLRVVRAAVRLADVLEAEDSADNDIALLRVTEEHHEAALAFARSLSKADRERLGR